MTKPGGSEEAIQSFERIKPRLAEIKTVARPSADPHSAAVTALLVADYLSHGAIDKDKLATKQVTPESIAELRTLARAMLHCLTQLGGDWFPLEGKTAPLGEIRDEGVTHRQSLVSLLEANVKDPQILPIVETIKKGEGDVDLVLDLRALSLLVQKHGMNATGSADACTRALAIADKAEAKLSEGEPPSNKEWRTDVEQIWTLFAPVYETLCTAARELSGEGVDSVKFPPLFTVSRARRTRKRASVRPPPGKPPESMRQAPPLPGSSKPAVPGKPAAIPQADPFARRAAPRFAVEMEVGIASDSNFYVGFTENLSVTGVFIATYSPKPIGSQIEVSLTLPTGDEMKVNGTVRWIRGEMISSDSWPGMGIAFDNISKEEEAKIKNFLRFREPMFFDDD